MQGAGHNFGIVTSFELKIHPKNLDTWHYHNYVFKQDKLEQFFEALNIFHNDGNTPVLMGLNMGGFLLDTTINDTEVSTIIASRTFVPRLLQEHEHLTDTSPSSPGHLDTLGLRTTRRPFCSHSTT